MSNTEHSQRPHFSEWKLPTLICSRLLNASKRTSKEEVFAQSSMCTSHGEVLPLGYNAGQPCLQAVHAIRSAKRVVLLPLHR